LGDIFVMMIGKGFRLKELKHKLTLKLFLMVMLCSTVVIGLSIATQVYRSYRAGIARIEDNVKFIGRSYMPSMADSLYKLDEPLLRLLLQGALKLQGVKYCEVVENGDGKRYRIVEGNSEGKKDIERTFVLRHRTQHGGYLDIGKLNVIASFEEVREQLWTQGSLNILINIFQIFLTAFIVLFIFQTLVSRHLSRMAAYARQLSIDNLEPVLALDRRRSQDELTMVVDAINDLRKRLKDGIEKRKQAEKVLRRYEQIVSGSRDLMALVGPDFTYEAVNDTFLSYHDTSREQVIGKKIRELLDPSVFDAHILPPFKRALAGETVKFILDLNFKVYGKRTIHVNYYPSIDAEGEVDGVILIGSDITDYKKAEDEKKQLQARLVQSQKLEAVGTLAGGIAHDFNNILAAVIGYSELLKMNLPKNSAEFEYAGQIYQAGNRAKNLVTQILTFSRQTEHELKPVDVSIIVKEVTKLLRSTLPTTIEIKNGVEFGSLVLGDPTKIHQILMNLCTNSGHAMSENGGVLTIEVKRIKLLKENIDSHANLMPGTYVLLSVSDTGYGIPKEYIDRIFDPFFTTKERGEGTGLGLSVVHGIVKSYHGAVHVYSEEGLGTTFKIFIPAIERPLEHDNQELVEIQKGTGHILFVDDELVLNEVAKSLLESLGYRVTCRSNSLEALELFKDSADGFDLVITDMTMPKMTGDKLASEIKNIRPDIPIILCTGFSSKITPENAKMLGIDAFLMKPIIVEEIAKTVYQLLNTKSVQ
jgi:PAS domain S-box-containing protein